MSNHISNSKADIDFVTDRILNYETFDLFYLVLHTSIKGNKKVDVRELFEQMLCDSQEAEELFSFIATFFRAARDRNLKTLHESLKEWNRASDMYMCSLSISESDEDDNE